MFAGSSLAGYGGDMQISSGGSDDASSGSLFLETADAGFSGVSGELTISTGISTSGISGGIALKSGSGSGDYGHGGNISLLVGASMSASLGIQSVKNLHLLIICSSIDK